MILVVAEHKNGRCDEVSFELLSAAKKLNQKIGSKIALVLMGHSLESQAKEMAAYTIDEVITIDTPALKNYIPDFYSSALRKLISERKPTVILFPYTPFGADLSPKIAAGLKVPAISSVNAIEFENNKTIFIKPVYNGKLLSHITLESSPQVISIERGAFPKWEERGNATISAFEVDLSSEKIRYKSLGFKIAEKASVDLTKAKIIVSGGRGVGKKENFKLIQDLAEILGGEYAASRPVVDNEWVERDRQVGSSGKVVSPNLYIACGISGAIQHLAGMKKSNVIVAINKDPEAPIFSVSTYGIVGDLFKVIPAVIEEIKNIKR